MTDARMQIKDNEWKCPVCDTAMGIKSDFGGILIKEDHILTPLICPNCGMECWIKSIPVSIVVFKDFEHRLKND
jgi:transcription elongation factor Elf1